LIAQIVKISEPTLRKNFRKELDTSKARANAIISQALFKKAKDGNVVAQIFWLKTQAGWKEKIIMNLQEKTEINYSERKDSLLKSEKYLTRLTSAKTQEKIFNLKAPELVQDSERETDNS